MAVASGSGFLPWLSGSVAGGAGVPCVFDGGHALPVGR